MERIRLWRTEMWPQNYQTRIERRHIRVVLFKKWFQTQIDGLEEDSGDENLYVFFLSFFLSISFSCFFLSNFFVFVLSEIWKSKYNKENLNKQSLNSGTEQRQHPRVRAMKPSAWQAHRGIMVHGWCKGLYKGEAAEQNGRTWSHIRYINILNPKGRGRRKVSSR